MAGRFASVEKSLSDWDPINIDKLHTEVLLASMLAKVVVRMLTGAVQSCSLIGTPQDSDECMVARASVCATRFKLHRKRHL